MDQMNCEHCNTIFKTKSALNYHKNNAKYCLTIQKEKNETVVAVKEKKFKCGSLMKKVWMSW